MSLRALPSIAIAFILYNIIVLFGGSSGAVAPTGAGADVLNAATEIMHRPLPILRNIPLPSGERWTMTIGDLLMLVTLILLFVELLKSTYTSTASLLDHGLSMLVFVACLIEFIVVPRAATSVFFFITVATLIDVIAGYTIGIRVARRDLSIGGNN
jgi:hypothetical protein